MNKVNAREVLIFDSEVVQDLISKLDYITELHKKATVEIVRLNTSRWMTIEEVAEFTGFGIDWVGARQYEIGYFNQGGGRRFRRADVDTYMQRHFIQTKQKTTGKRHKNEPNA